VASLTGDCFPANEHAGIFGPIVAGERIGIGFFMSGKVSAVRCTDTHRCTELAGKRAGGCWPGVGPAAPLGRCARGQ